ncbi:Exodeoxyribonuclease VII large subunit [Candidatus Koribacter versatilis Ellin345]|uniref:Exodeoxyribonuclease 7 large subunit n=1 Tax=Koribacter versatilis (strain Ellin345) TaxID=204669 RepID=EX7L_KORVE|nr:exodeoxyribonuclease VII large subunit [Candidatus Koribacter versatilis]Q1IV16.1 RecName: Full=Exodeoxyribonuclease 7 large subunit; AltName: Full=Exodeoxyribonuclease VII large subunit; Short=Exonuclease VII large subunit [Candidatus Koribacter versatilis Ellin345]ABF39284.1 Exodeoxyribonuclease VII large subunit [Candidatus Koribacter versatilis Ellin345]
MSFSDQLGFTFSAPQRRIWQVRDIVSAVRAALEREYADVWVEGEISNFRPADSGHLYFSLKDESTQLRIVMFRSQARLLKFRPENGLKVIARGKVTLYEGRGELQLMAEYLEPQGAGALQIAFEQLKAKLQAEGLFARERKKPIPALPKKIGVVTSPRGAVIQDILNVLRRRHNSVHVLIFPAQVQGETAASEVASGVRYFNKAANVEVIIVARGGGSIEDLAAFNDEGLARSIATSTIPVISAVGHETDFTICDFVADLRAPTPSAAAELVIRSKQEVDERLTALSTHLARALRVRLLEYEKKLDRLARHGAFGGMQTAIARRQQRVDDLAFRLSVAQTNVFRQLHRRLDVASTRVRHHDLRSRFAAEHRELSARVEKLAATLRANLMRRRTRIERLAGQLQGLSPISILERGYALVFDAEGRLLKDARQVREGNTIRAQLALGQISAVVKKPE